MILDNVDNSSILQHVLPKTETGFVLLTTRDFNIARELANASLSVNPLSTSVAADMLLRIVGLPSDVESNANTARSICTVLGGLPLAIAQMAGFIAQRKIHLSEFLPLYKQNAAKIDSRQVGTVDYEHTLSTVWLISLEQLSGASEILQKLMAFLEPSAVSESLLSDGSVIVADERLSFLNDELRSGTPKTL